MSDKWLGVILSAIKAFTVAFLGGLSATLSGYIPGTDIKKFSVLVLIAGVAAGLKAVEKFINWEEPS